MSDLRVPLSDDASQASRSSLSGSLLDRIRAQREKESAPTMSQPEPLRVPNYNNPVLSSGDEFNNNNTASAGAAWSMDFTLPRFGGGGNTDATMSLLGDEDGVDGEPYSMTRYFQTFVQDVYNGFRSLPPIAQGVVIVTCLVLAIWLLHAF